MLFLFFELEVLFFELEGLGDRDEGLPYLVEGLLFVEGVFALVIGEGGGQFLGEFAAKALLAPLVPLFQGRELLLLVLDLGRRKKLWRCCRWSRSESSFFWSSTWGGKNGGGRERVEDELGSDVATTTARATTAPGRGGCRAELGGQPPGRFPRGSADNPGARRTTPGRFFFHINTEMLSFTSFHLQYSYVWV